jgi:Cu/Ag efflux pump CusA
VRNSILYATVLIILVFLPLLRAGRHRGPPLHPHRHRHHHQHGGILRRVSHRHPVLCSLLLGQNRKKKPGPHGDGFDRSWHEVASWSHTFLRFALGAADARHRLRRHPLLIASLMLYPMMGKEFLPAFNEGSATISLANAGPAPRSRNPTRSARSACACSKSIPRVKSVGRRAGRAEKDDHVMPVSVNELDVEFTRPADRARSSSPRSAAKLNTIPGTFVNIGQPIGHRLSPHAQRRVSAKIAVKIFGPDLDVLREKGAEIATSPKHSRA